jgi:integral membrane protein
MNPLGPPLARFRFLAYVEGWSFLILLLIAMPLKYLAEMPLPVRVVGSVHGGLFVLYVISALEVAGRRRFAGAGQVALFLLAAAVASVVPFGTFALERWLARLQVSDLAAESR